MKIIHVPIVTLIGYPRFQAHEKYLVPAGTNAEMLVAHAGKGCYDSYGLDGRSCKEHIESLLKSKHGSVLEHVNFTLFIEGISRGLSHEMVRHRAGFAFSQRSTRYVDEGDVAIVLSPFMAAEYMLNRDSPMISHFCANCAQGIAAYRECITMLTQENKLNLKGQELRKWARGQARQLLPHAIETRMTVTANVRAWRHFIEQRSSRFAEDEIRRLANYIYIALGPVCESLLRDYEATSYRGIMEYTTLNGKV